MALRRLIRNFLKNVDHSCMLKLVKKFIKTGPSVATDANEIEILGEVTINPEQSVSNLETEFTECLVLSRVVSTETLRR